METVINNEQETVQEVSEKTEEEATISQEISSNIDSASHSNTNTEDISETSKSDDGYSNPTSSTEVQQSEVVEQQPPIETTQEVLFDTTCIEEKLDNIVALESSQITITLVFFGLLSALVVLFVLYRFISNFFEF